MKNHVNTIPQKVDLLEAFTHLYVNLSRVDTLWIRRSTGFALFLKYFTSQGSLGDFHLPSCCLHARAPSVLHSGFCRGLFLLQWDVLTARSPVPRTVRDNRVDR